MKTSKRGPAVFLGWEQPLLFSAVKHLRQEHGPALADPQRWNLGEFLAVLPTRRAGRRFRELLQQTAIRDGLAVELPNIITVGELPEFLYSRPDTVELADEFERTLAWTSALERADPAALLPVFPVLPARDALSSWIELASTLRRLHEDLASSQLTFADVATELANDSALDDERARWNVLQRLHEDYLVSLREAGRMDPFEARQRAVSQGTCHCHWHVLLIGTSDLSDALIAMLRQITQSGGNKANVAEGTTAVTALIGADSHYRDHFDAFGSIIASRWCQWKLPLDDSQLVPAGDVTDQAAAVSQWVEQIASMVSRDQPNELAITIGVPHESLVPPIEFELRQIGRSTYRELGWSFSQTPIGRLIELLSDHLTQATWQSLAALVRHADVYDYLEEWFQKSSHSAPDEQHSDAIKPLHDGKWLVSLDNLLAEHYPVSLPIPLTPRMIKSHPGAVAMAEVMGASLARLSKPDEAFAGSGRRLPISHWAAELKLWLQQIYPFENEQGDESEWLSPAQRRAHVAVRGCWKSLERLQQLEPTLDVKVSVGAAIDLIAGRLLDQRVGDKSSAGSIHIAGWLDLALEDSPAMAVVGLNHPYVPESVTADPFLPGGLRTRLKMSDNERRLGRDIYALQLILATRPHVRLIVGRTGVDGSPTPPSRLLAAAEPKDIARRLVRLLDDQAIAQRHDQSPLIHRSWDSVEAKTRLPIPVLGAGFDAARDVRAMSVTSFAAYLACPYRFYLRHILKLSPIDDSSRELAANQFGDLIHNSLEWFGNSAAKDSENVKVIEEAMLAALDQFAGEYLGPAPAPAVKLQIEQARRRLHHVAKQQAVRARQGWRIWKVEASVGEKDNAGIDVDGKRMLIRGRFDRIDRHQDGRWAILDYKTHGHPPRKKHLEKTPDGFRWVELQLPIYRLMIPYLVGHDVDPAEVTLGYFNVSEKETETKINEADFTVAEFAAADEVIRQCVRGIRAGRFEPANDPVLYDDYAMILQSEIAEQLFHSGEGESVGVTDGGTGENDFDGGWVRAVRFGGEE